MGKGYSFYCDNCKESQHFFVGFGMMFPAVYERTVKNIKRGRYGKEWQSFFETYPNGMINAYKDIYYCSECHLGKSDFNLSFYKPIDPNEPELTNISYNLDFGRYSLVKEYTHTCRHCGQRMINANRIIWLMPVKCPKCGVQMKYHGKVLWD
ncbi:MAG: hypothetical protein ACI4IJ_02705 [Acutalibacteraceae bacterium]